MVSRLERVITEKKERTKKDSRGKICYLRFSFKNLLGYIEVLFKEVLDQKPLKILQ